MRQAQPFWESPIGESSRMVEKAGAETTEEVAYEPRSFWRDAWTILLRDRVAVAGGALVLLLALLVILAPCLAPHNPGRQFSEGLTDRGYPVPPGQQFYLGSDHLGRDVLSRLLWGGRVSLGIGVASNFLAVAIGVAMGSLAGYLGGVTETLIMRIIDILMGFPVLLLAVGLIAVLDPNPFTITLVIAFVNWTYLSRIVYNMVRALKEREFIIAAHSIGVPHLRVLIRHILPHLFSIMVVYATLGIASSVMLESTLSYVGIGVQPPTPSWGNMINQGQRYYRSAPWLVLFPGGLIALSVLAFNLLGDGLRDAVDPYARGRKT